MIYYSIVIYYMSSMNGIEITMAVFGCVAMGALAYLQFFSGRVNTTGAAIDTGAGAGYSPYAPTTYDNLEGSRQQVYGGRGRGRKSKRMTTARGKRTDASRRRRR